MKQGRLWVGRRLCLLLVLATLPQMTMGMFRWQDAHGVTHFSQFPPPAGNAVRVPDPPGQAPADAAAAQQRLQRQQEHLKALATDREKARKEEEKAREARQGRERQCQEARTRLNTLTTFGRLRYVDASGEVRYMNDQEREQKTAEASKSVQESCSSKQEVPTQPQ
jgi:hypothetical protein